MKSLRRSLNSNNSGPSQTSPPLAAYSNPLARPSEKVAPPQKVIKALESHRSTNPQELSYNQGDFWYVTGEREGWYGAPFFWPRKRIKSLIEVQDPLTGSRGLVPKSDFEEFGKGGRPPGSSGRPGSMEQTRWATLSAGGIGQPFITIRSQTPSQSHLSHQSDPRSPPMPEISSPPSQNGPKKPRQPCVHLPGV